SPRRRRRHPTLRGPREQGEPARGLPRLGPCDEGDDRGGPMTAHLLLITLGPVQDFIAQARRTRDLWYGSHLLSELGRAAARALLDGGAQLIFPALKAGDPELVACPAPLRDGRMAPLNV